MNIIITRRTVLDVKRRLNFRALLYRAWFYFRLGYGTYVSFPLALVSFIVTVYYLAIGNLPSIQAFFPHMYEFAVVVVLVGIPLSTFIGWLHVKQTEVYSTEMDIQREANPYNYRPPPGFWTEVFTPFYKEQLALTRMLCERENLIGPEHLKRIREIEEKLQFLIDGGAVGLPKGRGARAHLKRDTGLQ